MIPQKIMVELLLCQRRKALNGHYKKVALEISILIQHCINIHLFLFLWILEYEMILKN